MEQVLNIGSGICKEIEPEDANDYVLNINKKWGVKTCVFPGPQPISIERKHMKNLKSNDYVVLDKSDGTRYALTFMNYNNRNVCALIDRNLRVFLIKFNPPKPCFQGTILDCELVKENENFVLLVFDCVVMCGTDVHKYSFTKRMEFAQTLTDFYKISNDDAFIVRRKQFEIFKNLRTFANTVKYVEYDTDGYIFMPENSPVTLGTFNFLYKWKKYKNNTVDFGINKNKELFLQKSGTLVKTRNIFIIDEKAEILLNTELESQELLIIECENDKDEKHWKFIQLRKDKSLPNAVHVFRRTLNNIKENIELKEFF